MSPPKRPAPGLFHVEHAAPPASERPAQAPPPGGVLVLQAHPEHTPSRVGAALLEASERISGVTVHRLYDQYPHGFIDVAREQAAVEQVGALVLLHPLYWYSVPPLLKEWMDSVLTAGWAHGRHASALRDKIWQHAITAGGSASQYTPQGAHRHTLDSLLAPLEQSARLCLARWRAPFVVYDTANLTPSALEAAARAWHDDLTALARETGDIHAR